MTNKAWIPLVVALALGLVAAWMARSMMAVKDPHQAAAPQKRLVVAREPIAPGQEISAEKLSLVTIAAEHTPEQTFTNTADVTGRVSAATIVPGQILIESLLTPKGSGSGLQALVPPGMRAITVEVDEYSGVAGLLVPGCHVDLMTTIQGGDNNEVVSRMVVQNVKVTAVGTRLTPGAPGPNAGDAAPAARSITLLVTPQEAQAVGLAAAVGSRPRLVLRNAADQATTPLRGITLAELRSGRPARPAGGPSVGSLLPVTSSATTQPAVSQPAPHRTVQVIRGGSESSVTFELAPQPAPAAVQGSAALAD